MELGIWKRHPIAFAIVLVAVALSLASDLYPRLKGISSLVDFAIGIMGLGLVAKWVWRKLRAPS